MVITQEKAIAHPVELGDSAIEIKDLVVNYGSKRAVDRLTLSVPKGSVYGFLGPNGAGKTTTIKTLLGFRRPDAGSATVLGYDIVADSVELRARTGYVSEVQSLYDSLTVKQMNDFCRSTARQWNQTVVDRYIKMFNLPEKATVRQLSKGMGRQLAFSLAMGSDPDLLILDEPTSGLDPIARHELLNRLVGEIASEGKTVFFSSHILSEVEAVADWIGIIKAGRLVVSDELDHLKQSQKVLKLVYAESPTAQQLDALKAMPGVGRIEQEGRSVRAMVDGDADALARSIQASGLDLRDIDVVGLNLEDLFLEYMKEDDGGY